MRLTYREAQRLIVGLRHIDEHNDTKLSSETRLRIGININRLMPMVKLFEKEAGRIQNEIVQGQQRVNGVPIDFARLRALSDELDELGDKAEEYKLKKFKLENFDLKQNAKIKGETLSQIAVLIRDFDDGEADED
jgi:hypothetical protein